MSALRVLITGITGLIGSHLADYLLDLGGVEVAGFKRWRSSEANIRQLAGRAELIEGDMKDPYSVAAALERIRPDRIFHLAAQSYPSESWAAPVATLEVNVLGTLHLLEAARRIVPEARIHLAGSAAAYGPIRADQVPIIENRPLRPVSPYGVSKAAQEMLGYQAYHSWGQQVYLTRSFIHIGPRQSPRPAAQTFARQTAEAEAGLRPPLIEVGNLETRRDFLDVADAVRALWAVVERGQPGEVYNLCAGRASAIRELLDLYLGMASIPLEVRQDPARLRPADEPILLGDNAKLRAATGWQPEVPLEESARRILDYWRRLVREGA
jgi:GDP-4-dehydro-6-deoxy-D-mannose reductase